MPQSLKTVTSINGRLVKRGDDKISVFDNSLLYGEGLFETFLAIDDRLIYFDEHYNRLKKGARVMGLKLSVDKETLRKWAVKTLKAHPAKIKKLRLTVTSGESARYVGKQGKQQIIYSASPHEMPIKPFKLYVSEFKVDQDSIFRRIKTLSYVIHAAALKQAKKYRCDDALMLNENNRVAEVTSANIFWIKNKKIYTTPLDSGCLEGITREHIIKQEKKLGYNVEVKRITFENLLKADEIFISSSLKIISPISRIRTSKDLYKINRGPITGELYDHFIDILKIC